MTRQRWRPKRVGYGGFVVTAQGSESGNCQNQLQEMGPSHKAQFCICSRTKLQMPWSLVCFGLCLFCGDHLCLPWVYKKQIIIKGITECARLRRGSSAGLIHWIASQQWRNLDPMDITWFAGVVRTLSAHLRLCCAHTAVAFPQAVRQWPQSRWHPSSLSYPSASRQNCLWGAITNSLLAEQHHKRCAVSDSQMATLKTEGNMSGKVPEAYLNNRNNRDVRRR